jgi:hypothetical protein
VRFSKLVGSSYASQSPFTHPLLWGFTFIPWTWFMESGNNLLFRAAQQQSKCLKERFIFLVEGWTHSVDPYANAPTINWGTAMKSDPNATRIIWVTAMKSDPKATRIIITLLVIQAMPVMEAGEMVQLLSKIKLPKHRWGFGISRGTDNIPIYPGGC